MTELQNELLNVSELKSQLHNDLGDYGDRLCDYSVRQCICDVISEIADSNTSIYYSDIKDFIINNFDDVIDAIDEMGWDGCGSDLMKAGQMAEFLHIEHDIYDHLDTAILNYCLDYIQYTLKKDTITQQQYEDLKDKCTNVDNNDYLDDFEDFCDELFEDSEDEGEDE